MPQTKTKKLKVSASTLPRHQDCPRAWAAHNLKEVGEKHELRSEGIGALVGKLCHSGGEAMLRAKRDQGEWDVQITTEQQIDALATIIRTTEIEWDRTTRDKDAAIKQIRSLLWEFHRSIMPSANPAFIEEELAMTWSPTMKVVGKPDYWEVFDGNKIRLPDHKFSSVLSPYQSQNGTYTLLIEAQQFAIDAGMEVVETGLNWLPRVSFAKSNAVQPKAEFIPYPVQACVNAAEHNLDAIDREVQLYRETGNPWSFNASPSSKLCGKKTCRAWGTQWCDQWVKTKNDEED